MGEWVKKSKKYIGFKNPYRIVSKTLHQFTHSPIFHPTS